MKRDPADYDMQDVAVHIAQAHGYSLPEVMALDFPQPDYRGPAGEKLWSYETVAEWLTGFHASMVTMEMAEDPERFNEMLDAMLDGGGGVLDGLFGKEQDDEDR